MPHMQRISNIPPMVWITTRRVLTLFTHRFSLLTTTHSRPPTNNPLFFLLKKGIAVAAAPPHQDTPLMLTDHVGPGSASGTSQAASRAAGVETTGFRSPDQNSINPTSRSASASCMRVGEGQQEVEGQEEGGSTVNSRGSVQRETGRGVKRTAYTTPETGEGNLSLLPPSLDEICGQKMDGALLSMAFDGKRHLDMSKESRHRALLSSVSLPELASHMQVMSIHRCAWWVFLVLLVIFLLVFRGMSSSTAFGLLLERG